MGPEAYRGPARWLDFCTLWPPEECPGETCSPENCPKETDLVRPGPAAQPMRPPTAPEAHPHACRVLSVEPPPPPPPPPLGIQATAERCAAVLGRKPMSFVRAASGEDGAEAPVRGEEQ